MACNFGVREMYSNNHFVKNQMDVYEDCPAPTARTTPVMYHERSRLQTFYNNNGISCWPKQHSITAEEVANSGFYYLGPSDRVTCPWCNLILRDWSTGDVGMAEHRRHSPQCDFVLQPDICGNVLIDSSRRPTVPRITPNGPKHPRFASYESRLATFNLWPMGHCQQPQGLAASGFFYTGIDDNVRCFHCDFGLREWTPEDDPWTEHAKWSPNCKFVLEAKGQEFVERAKTGEAASQPAQPPAQTPQAPTEDVEKQTEAHMRSPLVQVVLDMGYESNLVKTVITHKLRQSGQNFSDSSSLMDAVFEYENTGKLESKESLEEAEQPQPSTSVASVGSSSSTEVKEQTKVESKGEGKNLEDEIERLKEQQMCKICMDEDVAIVFVPCGHMCTCVSCSEQVTTCPICRLAIKGRVRAFLT